MNMKVVQEQNFLLLGGVSSAISVTQELEYLKWHVIYDVNNLFYHISHGGGGRGGNKNKNSQELKLCFN